MVVMMPVIVLAGAIVRAVRVDVNVAEHFREIMLKDFREDLRRDTTRRVVEVQRLSQTRDAIAATCAAGDGAKIVTHEQNGQPELTMQSINECFELLLSRGVEPRERLIERENFGFQRQRASDHDSLQLTAGDRTDRTIGV